MEYCSSYRVIGDMAMFEQEKLASTLKSRSRSSTVELVRDIVQLHLWFKFGVSACNIVRVIALSVISGYV